MKRLLALNLALYCLTASAFGAVQTVEQSALDFVSLLGGKEFHKAVESFDTNMKKAVTAAQLREIWNAQQQAAGTFERITGTRSEILDAYRIVFVTCWFEKQELDVKVVYDKAGHIAGLFFMPAEKAEYSTPEYVSRDAFKEIDVQVGPGDWALPGTLTVPVKKGPFPAVILVHGSGPNDRDETIGPNKPFRDLAWGLASKGIVVLRYEKRTRHYATQLAKSNGKLTFKEETIADACQAVSLLKKNRDVRADRIFVLGHSLGGMLIPRIAKSGSTVAGFVIMAANARPLEDLILEQTLYQASLTAEPTPEIEKRIKEVKRQVAMIKGLGDKALSRAKLLGFPQSYWLDLKGYRPAEAAEAILQPMLILQGEKDCQVSSEKDFEAWRRALSGRKNVTFKRYPTLNHLFMGVNGRSTGAEYYQPANVAPEVVRDIAVWIRKNADKL